jgi:hypothetical protein
METHEPWNPGTLFLNLENSIAPFWEMSMIEAEPMEGNPQTGGREVVHAEVGVYGQENGFQSVKPAFVSGAGEESIDRAWGRRVGINLCHSLTEWGSADHVFKTPRRIASGKAVKDPREGLNHWLHGLS